MESDQKKHRSDWKTILIAVIIGFIFGIEATILIGFMIDPTRYLR